MTTKPTNVRWLPPAGGAQGGPAKGSYWRARGDALRAAGKTIDAANAYARYLSLPIEDSVLRAAADKAQRGQIAAADAGLKSYLVRHPNDVLALSMLARLEMHRHGYFVAEQLYRRCLAMMPGFARFRYSLAVSVLRQGRTTEALAEVDGLLRQDPRNTAYRLFRSETLSRLGRFAEAEEIGAALVAEKPDDAIFWMSYGHVLRTLGKTQEAIAAYRRAVALSPRSGPAWWELANMKTAALGPQDIAALAAACAADGVGENDRYHLEFALAKALEDAGDYAAAFARYEDANRHRRALVDHKPEEFARLIDKSNALFTREFVAARQGGGCQRPDPIFILGMYRSGSTLIEQILSAHSEVEGTMELPDLLLVARSLMPPGGGDYVDVLAGLSAERRAELGEQYLRGAGVQRRTERPRFVDKQPANWPHVGLISLILPNARIIDARRDPVGCCLSMYKQHFARGAGFSYSIEELARHYRDYVRLMAHFDEVMPGRVHRVQFENLLDDTEGEVRRLLDHLGLAFEPACLRFWESDRPVYTPSAEQVRRPINRAGIDATAHFAPFLGPLREALGDLAGDAGAAA